MENNHFPPKFIESLSDAPGFNEPDFVSAHQNLVSPTSIRVNPYKYNNVQLGEPIPWCANGFYLNERPSFTFDPLFHAGCYYVQEASSMFIDHILKQILPLTDGPLRILDLCAAPGGKSTLISSAINNEDLLVANEIIKTRVPILADNLTRWGQPNIIVTNNDPKDFARLKGFFDIILVDAPCSGSGMFRKDPNAMDEWSEANVNLCQQRQERILADVYPALKEGGYLIYSTCSYSEQENEAVLDWLINDLEFETVHISTDQQWGIVESQSNLHKAWGYRFYPDKVKGEGLFAACLKKTGSSGQLSSTKTKSQKPNFKEIDLVKPYIHNADDFFYFQVNGDWLAIPRIHREDMELLCMHLYIKKSGVRLGKLAGKELIPDHELALSTIINKNKVISTELKYEEAIAYLRRDNIDTIESRAKGWSLMTYQGHALGWAKLLGNRINNYYPKELRIISSRPSQKEKE